MLNERPRTSSVDVESISPVRRAVPSTAQQSSLNAEQCQADVQLTYCQTKEQPYLRELHGGHLPTFTRLLGVCIQLQV